MHRALVARISYLFQDRPDLKFASMHRCCAMAKTISAWCQEDRKILRWEAKSSMLVPLATGGELEAYSDADWGRNHSKISVSWRDHERWTLLEGMDQEAASGVIVHRRERAVRRRQNRIRRAGDPERGKGLGDSMWAEPTSGCLSNDVPGQPQRIGQGETRRHAKPVDTGGIQVPSEHVRRRLNDEGDAETENRAAHQKRYETGGRFDRRKEESCESGRSHSEIMQLVSMWYPQQRAE